MQGYQIKFFSGGIADFEDRGITGAFKFGYNLNIRKQVDSLSCNQALKDIGNVLQSASASPSPSASLSPSASTSPSYSPSISPSASVSPSPANASASLSPSTSKSPSASISPSSSYSPSNSISPSPSPSAGIKGVWQDLIRFFVPCSDGNVYGFGNTGKVYKIDQYFNCSEVYDAREQITGAEEKPSYGGKTYLLFAGLSTLHRKEIPGRSDWNDVNKAGTVQGDEWPKSNLDRLSIHTMKQVAGDVMIANGPKLAMSAYDDSYTNEALDLIPGNIAKTIVERSGRAVVGTVRAANPNMGVNAAIDSEVPLIQVGSDGQLYFANFVDGVPIKRFPGGGKANPGGVCNLIDQVNIFDWDTTALSWIDKQTVGNMAMFGIYGAEAGKNGIYSYGRLNKNRSMVMNLEYLLDVQEIGALCAVNGILIVSYFDGVNFGVKITDMENKADAVYEGLDFGTPFKPEMAPSSMSRVELQMKPLPAGCGIEFQYKMDKTGQWISAQTPNLTNRFNTADEIVAEFLLGTAGEIYEPRVLLFPYGNETPEVYKAKTYFV